MAKISARNAYALVSVNAEVTDAEGTVTRKRYVARSDGQVLSRIVWQKIPGKDYYGKDGRLDFNSEYTQATIVKRNAEGVVQRFMWKLNPDWRTPDKALDHITHVLEKRGMTVISHTFG